MSLPPLDSYDRTDHGGVAGMIWLVIGAILFSGDPTARLFSWQALVYFLVGVFVAAAGLGGLSYIAVRGLTRLLTKAGKVPARLAAAAGYLVFAVQALLVYVVARWMIRVMF